MCSCAQATQPDQWEHQGRNGSNQCAVHHMCHNLLCDNEMGKHAGPEDGLAHKFGANELALKRYIELCRLDRRPAVQSAFRLELLWRIDAKWAPQLHSVSTRVAIRGTRLTRPASGQSSVPGDRAPGISMSLGNLRPPAGWAVHAWPLLGARFSVPLPDVRRRHGGGIPATGTRL
jgi:hypothetical protein